MYKCLECNLEFEKLNGFNRHIKKEHGLQEYYDKYIKKENEGFCKMCNKPTKFKHIQDGYDNCCNRKCIIKYTQQQTKKGNLKKYGVKNSFQRKDIRKKIKKTNIQKYGVNMPLQNKKIKQKAYKTMKEKYGAKTTLESTELNNKVKQTNLKKFGVEKTGCSIEIRNKMKETNLIKYGHENPLGNKKIQENRKRTMKKRYGSEYALRNKKCRDKFVNTCKRKYGVEYPMQNKDSFQKQQISGFSAKQYKDTNIYYRASYELDFLEKYFPLFPDIENALKIKYFFEKNRLYFPDFYIPSKNLIVECKNSYLLKRDKLKINAKENATIANGFNYIMIVDKDYSEFNNLFF